MCVHVCVCMCTGMHTPLREAAVAQEPYPRAGAAALEIHSHLHSHNQPALSGFHGEGLVFVRPLCCTCSAFTEEYGS